MNKLQAVKAEIERLRNVLPDDTLQPTENAKINWMAGKLFTIVNLEVFISSLEKEPDVDLEKEYNEFVISDPVYSKLCNGIVGKAIAKHFYELGRNTKEPEPQGIEEAAIGWIDSTSDGTYGLLDAFKAGAIWMFEKAPSEQAIAYVKASHSTSEVSEFQAAMNIAAAKAFDAGAKWMAEQGVSKEMTVSKLAISGETFFSNHFEFDELGVPNCSQVIVQIRKKEE